LYLAITITFNKMSCYNYALTKGIGTDIGDFYTFNASCKSRKQPKDHLLVKCEEWWYNSKNISAPVSEIGSDIGAEAKVTFSCVKRTYDGWLKNNGSKAKVTIRSCIGLFDSEDPLPDGCYRYRNPNRNSMKGYSVNDEDDRSNKQLTEKDFDGDTEVDVCICNTNRCNGAGRLVEISITTMFLVIILL